MWTPSNCLSLPSERELLNSESAQYKGLVWSAWMPLSAAHPLALQQLPKRLDTCVCEKKVRRTSCTSSRPQRVFESAPSSSAEGFGSRNRRRLSTSWPPAFGKSTAEPAPTSSFREHELLSTSEQPASSGGNTAAVSER